jgi:hypothetical protein
MSCISVLLESPEMGRKPLCSGDLGDLNDILSKSPKGEARLVDVVSAAR